MGTITEVIGSRLQTQGDNIGERSTTTFEYIADGYTDEPAVLAAVQAYAGATYGTQRYHSTVISEHITERTWRAKVIFIDKPATTTQFSGTGGTQHITQSIATVNSYGVSGGPTIPDMKRAINYDGQGVLGVEKIIPIYNWNEIHSLEDSELNIGAYYGTTGTVNSASFNDMWGNAFAAGEVLFLGADGIEREDGLWEVQFKFSYQPNQTGLSVGDVTGITKRGWDYLWISYKDEVGANKKIKVPEFVYVEQIYEYVDFASLGL